MDDDQYLVGVDIGGTTSKIGLFRKSRPSDFLAKTVVPARTESGGVHILPDAAEAISAVLEEAGAGIDEIAGIGIGVPGPVIRDKDTGNYLVNRCVNLGWGVKDVSAELSELTGVDNITVLNDANAAALGEVVCGTGIPGEAPENGFSGRTAVFVTIGTGIGGGIVKDGEVVSGAFGSAGEIGHMKTAPQHPLMKRLEKAYAEGRGAGTPHLEPFQDLEYYASATGIARTAVCALDAFDDESSLRELVTEKTDENSTAAPDYSGIDAKAVFDHAKAGDGLALQVVDLFADTLGTELAAAASVIDPDVFIVGGGVAAAGDFLLSRLNKAYRARVFHSMRETEFRLAVLGNDAGMIGAACALFNVI